MKFEDLKEKKIGELSEICAILRERILEVVSKNGGHLSSNLGVVELTVALHYVFDLPRDALVFDVSHQCYAHKLLSGRWDKFETLRQFGGISGYTKPCESEFDYFVAGHSSTSISLAVGAAKAFALKQNGAVSIALIGDGALSGGVAYEALNELGDLKLPCVIVLNDNEMSISKPIGAISKYLSQMMAGQFYQKFKSRVNKFLEFMPDSAAYMARRFEEGVRLITPGMFFEELGLEYIGPINGHNLPELISALKTAKSMQKPVVVHIQTIKGKGYEFSEKDDGKWHGVSAFDLQSGEALSKVVKTEFKEENTPQKAQTASPKSATQIFSTKLLSLAQQDEKVCGVTAAMPSGTGLEELLKLYPERFFDTGITEQHAVASMAALAKEGFKPFVAIYSTFLQRAYDQIIQEVALLSLPVVFCLDRAGIVGEDGETHQGVFDIAFLNCVPNLTLCAPRNEAAFNALLEFGANFDKPLAIRYPRGSFKADANGFTAGFGLPCEAGKSEILVGELEGEKLAKAAFLGYGDGVGAALSVAKNFESVVVVDLIFIKPLDEVMLKKLAKTSKTWFVFSSSAKRGGVGSILASWLQENGILGVRVVSFEFEDEFITHGKTPLVEASLGVDEASLTQKVRQILQTKTKEGV